MAVTSDAGDGSIAGRGRRCVVGRGCADAGRHVNDSSVLRPSILPARVVMRPDRQLHFGGVVIYAAASPTFGRRLNQTCSSSEVMMVRWPIFRAGSRPVLISLKTVVRPTS